MLYATFEDDRTFQDHLNVGLSLHLQPYLVHASYARLSRNTEGLKVQFIVFKTRTNQSTESTDGNDVL